MGGGGKGGREYHDFPSKNFSLTVPKNFAVEPFCAVFQKISGGEKVYGFMNKWGKGEGGREYHDFPSKNFHLTVTKNFVVEPFCAVSNFR